MHFYLSFFNSENIYLELGKIQILGNRQDSSEATIQQVQQFLGAQSHLRCGMDQENPHNHILPYN